MIGNRQTAQPSLITPEYSPYCSYKCALFHLSLSQVINGLMSADSNYTSFIKNHLYRNDLINLWPASILTAVLMIATRCLTCKQATDSIQWSVYLTVAAAFGVSVATESSGVAKAIADLFVSICECSVKLCPLTAP